MFITPISKLRLGFSIENKLRRAGIENSAHLQNSDRRDLQKLGQDELFALVKKMAFYNIRPHWVYSYQPPIPLDTRSSKELFSDGFHYIAGPYTQDEMWILLRAIVSLEQSDIKWVCAKAGYGTLELWRSKCSVTLRQS